MNDIEEAISYIESTKKYLLHIGETWYADYLDDAIELLKEQEAVEPYITGRGESFETAETWWYACGNCNEALDVNDKYCRHCGKPIDWEGR